MGSLDLTGCKKLVVTIHRQMISLFWDFVSKVVLTFESVDIILTMMVDMNNFIRCSFFLDIFEMGVPYVLSVATSPPESRVYTYTIKVRVWALKGGTALLREIPFSPPPPPPPQFVYRKD